MPPSVVCVQAPDEGEGVFVPEVGGTEKEDGCFVEGDGGATIREIGIIVAQESCRTGDIEALRILMQICQLGIVRQTVRIMVQRPADMNRLRLRVGRGKTFPITGKDNCARKEDYEQTQKQTTRTMRRTV